MKIYSGFFSETRNPKFKIMNHRVFDVDLVKLDLLLHLNTRKGERDMDPEFGSIVWDLLYEPRDPSLITKIQADMNSIIASDPRLELIDMKIDMDDLTISVAMIVRVKPHDEVSEISFTFQ